MASTGGSRGGVQSLDRAIQVLQTFTVDDPERGVSEIARLVGLTPSTAHRILTSLHHHGVVRQVSKGSRYALGPELMRLAYVAHRTIELNEIARPMMTALRDATDETVGLHVANDTPARMVVDQVESRQVLRRTYTEIGIPLPIHVGAPGKVLLANLPRPVVDAVLAGPLERATPRTISDADELARVLTAVREQGYAVSVDERVLDVSTVAVPVRDFGGDVMAALSVSGPSSRMTAERLDEIVPVAKRVGDELSVALGYVGASGSGSPPASAAPATDRSVTGG